MKSAIVDQEGNSVELPPELVHGLLRETDLPKEEGTRTVTAAEVKNQLGVRERGGNKLGKKSSWKTL